jgi:hypothetical protein
MTSLRTIPGVLPAALLAAALAVGAGPLGAEVLCVGAEGHVGVERLLAGCCEVASADLPAETGIAAPEGCGDCSDVQVRVPLREPEPPGSSPYPSAAAVEPPPATVVPSAGADIPSPGAAAALRSGLERLASVVLRT